MRAQTAPGSILVDKTSAQARGNSAGISQRKKRTSSAPAIRPFTKCQCFLQTQPTGRHQKMLSSLLSERHDHQLKALR